MPGFTSHLNLYKPGGGSTGLILPDEVVDIDRLNQNSELIDDWAETVDLRVGASGTRVRHFRGLTADIGTVPSPVEGDTYLETDALERQWRYDGSNWITNEGGMFLIRPSTVTGATVDAAGSVIPTAGAGEIDIDFTSFARFRAVKVVFHLVPAAPASAYFSFRRAAVNLGAASSYATQRQSANGGTGVASYVTNGHIDLGVSAQARTSGELTILNAGQAIQRKSWIGQLQQGPANPQIVTLGGEKVDSEVLAAITGFAIGFVGTTHTSDAGTFLKVYGIV